MKTLLVTLLTLVVAGATLLPEPADAKRFGGGRSLGKQYSVPRQAPPSQQAQQPQAQPRQTPRAAGQPGPRQSGASRWLGPLAGLAAGGLLASLFFGDGFQGFQILDFLLIALLVFGGVMLFRRLRRQGGGAPVGRPAGALGGAQQRAAPLGGHVPMDGPNGAADADGSWSAAPPVDAPAWFDPDAFVQGAKSHFIRLQAAWDRGDLAEIRSYTSPELFEELERERKALGTAPNETEVVRLDAELLGTRREGDRLVASLRFSGLIREQAAAGADPLEEIWHVAHRWDSAAGDWIIIGIQQPGR